MVTNKWGAGRGLLACLLVFALGAARAAQPETQPENAEAANAATVSLDLSQPSQPPLVLAASTSVVLAVNEPLKRAVVSAPEVLDARVISPLQVLVAGRKPGRTQLILWDKQDRQTTLDITVERGRNGYESDLASLRLAVQKAAPGSNVQVEMIGDTVVLRGQVADVDSSDRLVQMAKLVSGRVLNHLTLAGEQQVLLRCTVAEVNKNGLRQLGINGWAAGENFKDAFVVNQIDNINPVNIGAAGSQNVRQDMVFATDKDGLNLLPSSTLSLGFPRVQMQLFLKALRQNTLMRILAEPNLVALNGQEAKFVVGGEFPVPVPQGGNSTAITIEFKEFGIRLAFTPTLIGRQMIRLKVRPEVSEPDFTFAVPLTGFRVPGLKKRSAETTLELASGTTIAVAGLLSEEIRGVASKVPAVGDIPVLGQLFSSVEYQRNITELVVLVTPELVTAMNPDQVPAVPGQHMMEPNDFELFGLGMIEGEPLVDESTPEDALTTPAAPTLRKYNCPPAQMSLHGPWGPADLAEGKVE